jgi:glyceraldehyde 3-phosphate dehydrogenase
VPWSTEQVDIVLECSGTFRTAETLEPHFSKGVKTVIVAAPVKSGALNIVMGVNDHLYQPATHRLLTAASCTTNCLAPVVKVIHESIGIKHGIITTIHDITNTQVVVDAPHKDLRRARASSLSLIPTSTGSATAIGLIYPELLGKLIDLRVPRFVTRDGQRRSDRARLRPEFPAGVDRPGEEEGSVLRNPVELAGHQPPGPRALRAVCRA